MRHGKGFLLVYSVTEKKSFEVIQGKKVDKRNYCKFRKLTNCISKYFE